MQSLARGLAVIQSIMANGPCTLHEIHLDTNLPKPTLLRFLEALEGQGVVFRPIDDRRYRISSNSFLFGRTRDLRSVLQEVSVPILSDLCRDIAWPTDLTVRDGHRMIVVTSNRMLSPFSIKPSPHGHQPDMLLTAVGRAYLAYCSPPERDEIIAGIRHDEPDHALARDDAGIQEILTETRRRGYGVRSKFKHDGFNAIAVPVLCKSSPVACINLFFYRRAVSVEAIAAEHLVRLKSAAAEIAAMIENSA